MQREASSARRALAFAAIGLTLCVAAPGLALSMGDRAGASASGVAGSFPEPGIAPDSAAITINGPGDVAIVNQVYEPAQASGWHLHSGLHAVAVLSGELTVYDRECRPQRVGPGEPYVGGQELHLARNETAEPVHMVVTYINPSAGASTTAAAAPKQCEENGASARQSS